MTPRNLVLFFGAAALTLSTGARAATCESLSSLALPHSTITMAQTIRAGSFVAPGRGGGPGQPLADLTEFCRVQASLRPTRDATIKMEIWLPAASSWNSKLRGTGNGGLGGGA